MMKGAFPQMETARSVGALRAVELAPLDSKHEVSSASMIPHVARICKLPAVIAMSSRAQETGAHRGSGVAIQQGPAASNLRHVVSISSIWSRHEPLLGLSRGAADWAQRL
jgi:hypothetical protein